MCSLVLDRPPVFQLQNPHRTPWRFKSLLDIAESDINVKFWAGSARRRREQCNTELKRVVRLVKRFWQCGLQAHEGACCQR